jgi:hypothetical protein
MNGRNVPMSGSVIWRKRARPAEEAGPRVIDRSLSWIYCCDIDELRSSKLPDFRELSQNPGELLDFANRQIPSLRLHIRQFAREGLLLRHDQIAF